MIRIAKDEMNVLMTGCFCLTSLSGCREFQYSIKKIDISEILLYPAGDIIINEQLPC
jgi:hypothetical protein